MCLALTIFVWHFLRNVGREQTSQLVRQNALNLQNNFETQMKNHISGLERMAERWSRRGGTPRAEWIADAERYVKDFNAYQAVVWVDQDSYIRWMMPEAGNEKAQNFNLSSELNRRTALEEARATRKTTLSHSVELVQGGKGFLVFVPIYTNGEFGGFITGIFRINKFIESNLPPDTANDYAIQLFEGSREIYQSAEPDQSSSIFAAEESVNLNNISWQLRITPKPSAIYALNSATDKWALVIGIFLSGLLAWIVRLGQQARRRAFEATKANAGLEIEIRERVRVQRALQETSMLQKAVLNGANYMIIATDPDGVIISFNKAAEKNLGYRAEEIIGKTTPAILHDPHEVIERAAELSEEFGHRIEPGFEVFVVKSRTDLVEEREWTYVRKNGSRFPVTLSVTALRDENGEITGFLGIGSDITERLEFENELQKEREFLEAVLENISDGIVACDSDGRLTIFNRVTRELHGIPADGKIEPEKWAEHYDLFLEDGKTPMTLADIPLFRALQGEFVNACGMVVIPKNHSPRQLMASGRAIFDRYGRKLGAVVVMHDITEQKRAEEEIRAAEERFKTFMNKSPAVSYLKDSDGKYIFMSETMERFFNVSVEKLRGKTDFSWLPEDVARTVREKDEMILSTGETLEYPLVVTSADGVARTWQTYKFPVYDASGKSYIGVVAFDVTRQKESEKALRKSEQYNRDLIEKSPGLICTHTLEGVLLSVNPAAAKSLGYDPKELVGRSLCDFLPAERQPLFQEFLRQIEINNGLSGTMRVLGKNGEERTWSYTNTIYEQDGVPYVLGHAFDITESRRAEVALHESERRVRNLLEHSPVGIALTDAKGGVMFVNERWCKMSGLTLEQARGEGWTNAIHPKDRRRIFKEWKEKSPFEEETTYEFRFLTREGKITEVITRAIKQYDEKGVFSGHLSTISDITEIKRLSADLKEARDAALESARMKSEFLANMSHEIRTPMNGVIGMTDMLLTTGLDAEQREHAEIIKTSADGLLNIINDILDFSKIEAGKLNFETIPFNLLHTVESTIELFAAPAQRKSIEIASLIESDINPNLCGDPGRLRQVLNNLIGNAVKFTEKGEVTIRVAKESENGQNCRLRFYISDTGIGIKPEEQRYLFQAFTQADGSMTRKFGGTGLGLAISKQLIELMDGEITVESAPGEGSVFSFTASFEKQTGASAKKLTPRPNLENLRVLIADDNATNRKILRHQITSWGMTAVEAENGVTALGKLRAAARGGEPFDLAILDLMMPGMNGFELAHFIRADRQISSVKLILMPSYGQRGHAQSAKEIGIDCYLVKPVRQSELFDCVSAVMAEEITPNGDREPEVPAAPLITSHVIRENKKHTILIAEDNLVNQKVALMQLQQLGYQTDVVSNGREALQAVRKRPYSLVLMDCQMPEMDGYTATAEIRRTEPENRRLPIVAMTANAMEGEREKCLAAGMDDFITKPVKADLLARTITRWLLQTGRNDKKASETVSAGKNDVGAVDSSGASESLDRSILNNFRELQTPDAPDLVTDLIHMFLEDSTRRIESIKTAIGERNAGEIKEQVHALKGSSGNIGAFKLAQIGKRIEENLPDEEIVRALFDELCREHEKVKALLQTMCAKAI